MMKTDEKLIVKGKEVHYLGELRIESLFPADEETKKLFPLKI